MKKCFITVLSLIMAFIMAIPVFADAETKADSVIDTSRTGTLTINYQDDETGKSPVVGAQFKLYKVAEYGAFGSYDSIIHNKYKEGEMVEIDGDTKADDIIKLVKAAYEKEFEGSYVRFVKTDKDGIAIADELPLGLYLVEETIPAEDHLASIPFLFDVPFTEANVWNYEVEVEPKSIPLGKLIVSKTVTGNAGEKDKEFHFKITFAQASSTEEDTSDTTNKTQSKYVLDNLTMTVHSPSCDEVDEIDSKNYGESNESLDKLMEKGYHVCMSCLKSELTGDIFDKNAKYPYKRSDGKTGTIKSGDTVALKSGQTVTVSQIPVGVSYVVTEVEANQNDYKTTATDDKGTIVYKNAKTAKFVNKKDVTKKTDKGGGNNGRSGGGSNGSGGGSSTSDRVKTGDAGHIAAIIAAIVASVCVIGYLIYSNIKKKKDK